MGRKRLKIDVQGRVQGVGFRPMVYRYARQRNLTGWVLNSPQGVVIEIEGEAEKTDDFVHTLKSAPPPQAEIVSLSVSPLPVKNEKGFRILPSIAHTRIKTQVSPDIAICPDCLRELFDPNDRRFRYPFINCTNCGPRFTIVKNIPYDRKMTTMKKFVMCPRCQAEYDNPLDRRFHAQPNACPVCGPEVTLLSAENRELAHRDEAIKLAVRLLKEGKIVAIKGLGGFHLACDATNDKAVRTLRERKYRYDKPFALMARELETVKNYCEVSGVEEELLTSPRSPIVLLSRRKESPAPPISENVAPNNKYLGFMLPYTPLHHLLLRDALAILVMTSGNMSEEPIAYKNEDAVARLRGIADFFLLHNRDIYIRCDDSVTRIFPPTASGLILRRSRGYVPAPIKAPFPIKEEILACGAHLNNTFALAKGDEIFVSHYIGDIENLETLTAFETGIEHFKNLFEIEPDTIACDLHPEYLSTKYAQERAASLPGRLRIVPVQHHHAHIASCMADNGLANKKVIGVAFDGTGYGADGNIWGGEFLIADYEGFERACHLKYMPLPGGEMAIREPWRIAAAYLYEIFGKGFLALGLNFVSRLDKGKCRVLEKMIEQKINTPLTSSMGRLFDAVSALVGVREKINYEGQAAIELEMAIEDNGAMPESYKYSVTRLGGVFIINPADIIAGVVKDTKADISSGIVALKFHNTIADIIGEMCRKIRTGMGINDVALSGGVFQNMYLLTRALNILKGEGFRVYVHRKVPPNDGGISLGQAVIAAAGIKEQSS